MKIWHERKVIIGKVGLEFEDMHNSISTALAFKKYNT